MVTGCRIGIERDLCLSCAACPPVCHSGALVLRALYLELAPELCDNCLLCVSVCPVGAIVPDNDAGTTDTREHPEPY